jgi:hypothetical protein
VTSLPEGEFPVAALPLAVSDAHQFVPADRKVTGSRGHTEFLAEGAILLLDFSSSFALRPRLDRGSFNERSHNHVTRYGHEYCEAKPSQYVDGAISRDRQSDAQGILLSACVEDPDPANLRPNPGGDPTSPGVAARSGLGGGTGLP